MHSKALFISSSETHIMSDRVFKAGLFLAAVLFTIIFCFLVIPPLIESPNIIAAFAAGFVNPFAAGYSTDVFFCWFVLAIWVWFEASNHAVKHGWVCLVLGVIPGVAVGFALYLLIRHSQLTARSTEHA
tara:strand:- start:48222 stop:48608 length:387 start_codon:yes stop_codon:yes gene_type:complete